MAQGLFVGMTSYDDQSLPDIQKDINRWQAYAIKIKNSYEKTIHTLKSNNYWFETIDFDVRNLFLNTHQVTQTFLNDFSIINKSISDGHITEREVNLLKKIGNTSSVYHVNYGKVFKNNKDWHDYGESNFRLAEKLYEDGRDFYGTLMDAANAAERLKDYMTTDSGKNTFIVNGTGHNIQQSVGGNMKMELKSLGAEEQQEVKDLVNQLLENLDSHFTEEGEKQTAKEFLEVIQAEAKKEDPKPGMVKTALKGLQALNQSANFVATVARIGQITGYLG